MNPGSNRSGGLPNVTPLGLSTSGRDPVALVLDAAGRLNADLICAGCGYNLRGQNPAGACSECGRPVWHSVRLARLIEHDPVWLKRLADAFGYLAVGFAVIAVAALAIPVAILLQDRGGWLALATFGGGLPTVVVCGVAGAWLVTRREPGAPVQEGWVVLRLAARWLTALGLGAAFATMVVALARAGDRRTEYIAPAGLAAAALSLVLGGWATFRLASRFARQIPSRALAWQTRVLSWLCLVIPLLVAGGFGSIWLMPALVRPVGLDWFALLRVLTAILQWTGVAAVGVLLLVSVWALPVMLWCRRRFREAARVARQRLAAPIA